MNYLTEEIEDQLIATLQADSVLAGVDVRTHAGDVNLRTIQQASMGEGWVTDLPFIYVQYAGKTGIQETDDAQQYSHDLKFRFYVGAQSLRATQEAQRFGVGAYRMLRQIYDDIHGHHILQSNLHWSSGIPALSGQNTASAVYDITPFREFGGQDELLLVNAQGIVVYQTDYKVKLIA